VREPVLPSGIPQPLDKQLLAWASGFFDGEGSTIAKTEDRRPGYSQLLVAVPQSGNGTIPEVLQRFRTAALGTGRFDGPDSDGIHRWIARGRVDAETTLALLWPQLGSVKRTQAQRAISTVDAQYDAIKRRAPRYSPDFVAHTFSTEAADDAIRIDMAWAAGFLDAEGWFGVVRGTKRKDGSHSLRIRVSAPQHSMDGTVPEVLRRLKRVLGGSIERHGDPDDFKWIVYGRASVARVYELTAPWLGEVKRVQAAEALRSFDAQPRFRGDGTTCKRGHTYDAVVVRPSGKIVKVCRKCDRLTERARRRAAGSRPRKVRQGSTDPTRIYRAS